MLMVVIILLFSAEGLTVVLLNEGLVKWTWMNESVASLRKKSIYHDQIRDDQIQRQSHGIPIGIEDKGRAVAQ